MYYEGTITDGESKVHFVGFHQEKQNKISCYLAKKESNQFIQL